MVKEIINIYENNKEDDKFYEMLESQGLYYFFIKWSNMESKIHSYIECEKGAFWYKNENSKNGSTLILKEEDYIKIQGKMRFKLEGIPFTIEEIDGNKEENNNLINIVNKEDEEDEEED